MFVRTERLTLRPGWPEDAPALARAIADPGIVTMLARAPWPYTLDDARAFLALPEPVGLPRFLVFEHVGPDVVLVGGIGIHADECGERELGYWLAPSAQGRGLMTEAGMAVLNSLSASLNVRRLVSSHFADNVRSARVLARLGFRPTGEVRTRPCLSRGGEVPCVMHEWQAADDRVSMAA